MRLNTLVALSVSAPLTSLFSQDDTKIETELVISVTPRLVQPASDF